MVRRIKHLSLSISHSLIADAPIKDIHTFIGTFTMNKPINKTSPAGVALQPLPPSVSPLTAENLLWANTVLAAGSAVGFVIYTGSETRAVMNTSHPETKVGLLDLEINNLSKVSPLLSRLGLCLNFFFHRSFAPSRLLYRCSSWP